MSRFKEILAEVEMSRRGFLKAAGAAGVVAATPSPVLAIAKELIKPAGVTVSSLSILYGFLKVIKKIDLSTNDVGQMLCQWSTGRQYSEFLHLAPDEEEELDKKLGDKYWEILGPFYRDFKYAGRPEDDMPWKPGMAIEPIELSSKRDAFIEKLLGRKTKHSMLNDWAKSLGFPTFEHLCSSPNGKIIVDNIHMLSSIDDTRSDPMTIKYGQQLHHWPYDPVNNVYYTRDQIENGDRYYGRPGEEVKLRKDFDRSKYSGQISLGSDPNSFNLVSNPKELLNKFSDNSTANSTTNGIINGAHDEVNSTVHAALDTAKSAGSKWRLLSAAITLAKKLLTNKSSEQDTPTEKPADVGNTDDTNNTNNTLALPAPEKPEILEPNLELDKIKDLAGIKKSQI